MKKGNENMKLYFDKNDKIYNWLDGKRVIPISWHGDVNKYDLYGYYLLKTSCGHLYKLEVKNFYCKKNYVIPYTLPSQLVHVL